MREIIFSVLNRLISVLHAHKIDLVEKIIVNPTENPDGVLYFGNICPCCRNFLSRQKSLAHKLHQISLTQPPCSCSIRCLSKPFSHRAFIDKIIYPLHFINMFLFKIQLAYNASVVLHCSFYESIILIVGAY